jgi:DNA-binding transcriptional regulator YiaG
MSATEIEKLTERISARKRLPSPAARRAIRLATGATLEDVGRAVGVSKQAVHSWEAGVTKPRGETLVRYITVLDTLRELA